MAAASYHLAHLSARAYSLLAIVEANKNFPLIERVLAQLMRRSFGDLRTSVLDYRASGEGSDGRITAATLEWVDWFNNRRLLEPIGNTPPAEAEANFYAALENEDMAA